MGRLVLYHTFSTVAIFIFISAWMMLYNMKIERIDRKTDLLLKEDTIDVEKKTDTPIVANKNTHDVIIYDGGGLRIRGPEDVARSMEKVQERYDKQIDPYLKQLLTAIDHQDRFKVTSLLKEKPYLANKPDPWGKTPLIDASWYGNSAGIEILQILIDNGANVNLTDQHNNTALSNTQFTGNVEGAKLLLRNGANPHIKNINTGTSILDDLRKKMAADLKFTAKWKKEMAKNNLKFTDWKEVIAEMEKVKK